MSDIDAALVAMDTAQQEAREIPLSPMFPAGTRQELEQRWARDRLRLIRRDRVTLARHGYGERPGTERQCVQAVIDHWTADD